jgi:homoserine kinase type II
MKTIISEEMILDDLIKTFQRLFELNVLESTPVKRGWLNLKWKITTDSGQFLLKQYNEERYKMYKRENLLFAFTQQVRLYNKGIRCPNLLSHNEDILLESDNGERFMAMEFCKGKVISPGKANVHQMYDLGKEIGKMHGLLNDGTLGIKDNPKFIPPCRKERLQHWNSMWEQAKETDKIQLLTYIEVQRKATEDLNIEIFDYLQSGWGHRDLWVDNLLFDNNELTAILDFDRLNYDYPQLDVARAVMSCALDDNFDVSLASAFIEGYSEECNVSKGYLTNALQLLWYMESTWWTNAYMDQHSLPPARFAKEMIWLAENQKNLSDLLENI